MSSAYSLVIDTVPLVTDDEHELATRLVNRQPDAAFLRLILGLDVPKSEPQPEPVHRGVCKKHGIEKRVRPNGEARCQKCQQESDRRKRDRQRMERERAAQTRS